MSDDCKTTDPWKEAMDQFPWEEAMERAVSALEELAQTPCPRPLAPPEEKLIAHVKAKAEEVSQLLNLVERSAICDIDRRWLSIGKTHLQEGFMAVIRAIEQPEGF